MVGRLTGRELGIRLHDLRNKYCSEVDKLVRRTAILKVNGHSGEIDMLKANREMYKTYVLLERGELEIFMEL